MSKIFSTSFVSNLLDGTVLVSGNIYLNCIFFRCIRVGGKNCDLQQIGHDGHHLSYFEMLGNWAFDDSYGREKSIKQAWNLLTNVYNLPPERLFVTYFGGCEKLGLLPDHDTKEIWRSMGVDPNRILPFGEADNFWRMGLDGPCGPCTEIHYSFV